VGSGEKKELKMSSKQYRVGIAGYGVVGKRRRAFIDQNPNFKTVAISDVTFKADERSADGVEIRRHYESLFEQELDVLFVCLPNFVAADATINALRKGLHVFCEKPPGRNLKDIQDVIEVEKLYPDLKLKYGFNHRYHYSVLKAKEIIDSGTFGPIVNLRGVYGKSAIIPDHGGWRSERKYAGGGILLDQGIHMLDMIRLFAGDFDEIKSFVSNAYWNHDVEDNAYALLRNSSNGCIAMLHSTATQWQHRFRLEITLREALLELTGILSGSKSYGEEKLAIIPRKGGSINGSFQATHESYLEDHSWRDEVNEFANLVVENKKVINGNSQEALKVMELVQQIYLADNEWQKKFDLNSR